MSPATPQPLRPRPCRATNSTMLVEDIKAAMFAAMKAKSTVEKEILRVALGEIQTQQARSSDPLDDKAVIQILRKLVKSNGETLKLAQDEEANLGEEIAVLERFLPKTLDSDAILTALAPIQGDIQAAKADGQAIGLAMKHLKGQGAVVQGNDVAAAVRQLRSSAPA